MNPGTLLYVRNEDANLWYDVSASLDHVWLPEGTLLLFVSHEFHSPYPHDSCMSMVYVVTSFGAVGWIRRVNVREVPQ